MKEINLPQDVVALAFCPTGPGGGVDNSCSSQDGGSGSGGSGNETAKALAANYRELLNAQSEVDKRVKAMRKLSTADAGTAKYKRAHEALKSAYDRLLKARQIEEQLTRKPPETEKVQVTDAKAYEAAWKEMETYRTAPWSTENSAKFSAALKKMGEATKTVERKKK